MKAQDMEQMSSSPPSPHHHYLRHVRHERLVTRAYKTLMKPSASNYFTIFVIAAFVFTLGYLFRTQSLLSQATNDLLQHNTFPARCSEPLPSNQIRQRILDQVFNGTSPWEKFPPPHVSPLLLGEWAKGWGSNAAVFEHLIQQVRPKTIIEVGTFLGASAIHMAGLTDAQIICIDDFRGWPGYMDQEKSLKMVNGDTMLLYQFMQNVVHANATESIVFMPFSTATALGGLCGWGVYGDLIEIDAAHDFHSAWVDINNAYKLLRPGGVMFGHDYVWAGVQKAVHLFARLNGFGVRIHGEHWILY